MEDKWAWTRKSEGCLWQILPIIRYVNFQTEVLSKWKLSVRNLLLDDATCNKYTLFFSPSVLLVSNLWEFLRLQVLKLESQTSKSALKLPTWSASKSEHLIPVMSGSPRLYRRNDTQNCHRSNKTAWRNPFSGGRIPKPTHLQVMIKMCNPNAT